MSFYLCGLGVKESRLEQLDEIQVKVINTFNGKNLSKCPSLIFELTGVAFGKIVHLLGSFGSAPAEGPLTQPRNFVVMMGFPVYEYEKTRFIQRNIGINLKSDDDSLRVLYFCLGVEEVVEVWIKFFGSPTTENCRARYEGRVIRETSITGRLIFMMNLSATFICEFFKDALDKFDYQVTADKAKSTNYAQVYYYKKNLKITYVMDNRDDKFKELHPSNFKYVEEEEMLYKGSPFLLHFKLVLVRHRGVSISYHAICVVIEHRSMGGSL
ncbi:hypothetical protein JHK87_053051 [Glycine soja]|nr:hypothetical protein JHK87_053051 [Glycine soja]